MGKPTGFMEYRRELPGYRPPRERIHDWQEINLYFPDDKLQTQGARCMDCGIPFCHTGVLLNGMASGCPINNLIPDWNDLVYRWEWKYLEPRTSMWKRWRPRNEDERESFMDYKADCDIYVKCEGAARCDRRYRSFVCRVFPLEPYVENDWSMSGLIFNTDFIEKCPLVKTPHKIRHEYIMGVMEDTVARKKAA